MIVLIEKNERGKIEFTKEELEDILEKARAEGVKEGQKYSYIYTTPPNSSPLQPNTTYISPFTCQTQQTIATSKAKLNDSETTNGI